MSNRSPKDIAGEFGIHPKTVRRYRNKLFAPMVPATRGRHILVSSAMNEYVKVLLIKGALKTAKDAHRMLMRLGYSMPYRSAINVLVPMSFYARRKKRQPLLTYNHRKQSCRYYSTQPGDVLRPHHIDLSVKHGSGKLTMWGCITSEGSGYACQVYDGTMDSLVYQHILGTTYMETLKYYGMNKRTIYL
ncbi:hypothetical protein G6F20_013128 [Rhizopus arrhizus]|nr:hypothetical protein G6F20_013128 [Rhizopus arrhizus]